MSKERDEKRQQLCAQLVDIIRKRRSEFANDYIVHEFQWNGHCVEGVVALDGTELSFDDGHRHFESWDEWVERGSSRFLCALLYQMAPDINVPLRLFRDVFQYLEI